MQRDRYDRRNRPTYGKVIVPIFAAPRSVNQILPPGLPVCAMLKGWELGVGGWNSMITPTVDAGDQVRARLRHVDVPVERVVQVERGGGALEVEFGDGERGEWGPIISLGVPALRLQP
jgi:hypothetical protein